MSELNYSAYETEQKWQAINETPQVNSVEEIFEFAREMIEDSELMAALDSPASGQNLIDRYNPLCYQFASDYFERTGINISPESTFIASGLFMDMQLEDYSLDDEEKVLTYLKEWVELVFEE